MDGSVMSDAWDGLYSTLAHVPDEIVSVLILAVAVVAALVVQRIADRILRRALSVRQPLLYSLLLRMEGPFKLAISLLALNIAVAAAPLDPSIALWLGSMLQVAFIALIGWMALTALNLAADIYLRRFDLAAADNLLARKQVTQIRVLKGAISILVVVITVASALMTFEEVRQYGVSLFASAGIASLVAGFAARPMLSNLIAGVQLAITQPIRLDDAIIVEGEWGRVEEITATYVVVRIWDLRRMIVPLTYFIEKPFQNWTRENASLIGVVTLRLDFGTPVAAIRAKAAEIVEVAPQWDRKILNVQVTDCDDRTMEVRVIAGAADSGAAFDLRCLLREELIAFLQAEHPLALPRAREEFVGSGHAPREDSGSPARFPRAAR